jgi:hypothetical protein
MSRKITTEVFQEDIDKKFGKDIYIVKGEYTGGRNNVEILHTVCNETFLAQPRYFYNAKDSSKVICTKCNKLYRRTPEEFIKDIYSVNPDIDILSTEPIKNVRQVITVKCKKCGRIDDKPVKKILEGNKCIECKSDKQIAYYNREKSPNLNKTLSQDAFKEKLKERKSENFEVLDEYKGYDNPIRFYHKVCGNEFTSTPRRLLKIKYDKCPCCPGFIKKRTYEELLEEIKTRRGDEFILKTDHYENNKQKMVFYHSKCKQEFEMRIDCFLRGDPCPKCQKIYGNEILPDEYIDKVKEMYGDEYEIVAFQRGNTKKKVTVMHHCTDNRTFTFSTYASDFLHKGRKCPRCFSANHVSTAEKEIVDFLRRIYNGEVVESCRTILDNNQEIDIYIPEFKLAIEYDGLYYHSDLFKPDNYHYNKYAECKDKGITLIHIFEDEWLDDAKRKIIKRKLRYLLKQTGDLERIHARKCEVREIDYKIASKFLDTYHIQGKDKANIYLGLYYNGKLYSVMSFCKPRKFLGKNSDLKYDYELSRFASNTHYIVNGAFSKLLDYFKDNYSWTSIITYADRRFSSGDTYLANGWTKIRDNKVNYYYTDNKKRYNRTAFMKGKIKIKFPEIYNENKTEREMMKEAGYNRIYDCGTITFIYTKEE